MEGGRWSNGWRETSGGSGQLAAMATGTVAATGSTVATSGGSGTGWWQLPTHRHGSGADAGAPDP